MHFAERWATTAELEPALFKGAVKERLEKMLGLALGFALLRAHAFERGELASGAWRSSTISAAVMSGSGRLAPS